MDKIEEQEDEQKKDGSVDKAKNIAKQVLIKKYKKVLIISLIGIVLAITPIMIIISVFSGTSDEVKKKTSESGMLETTVKIEDRHLKIDANLKEIMDEYLKSGLIDAEAIGIGKDYTVLQKFLEAEVVTSFPDLRSRNKIGTKPNPADGLQGIIQINRQYSNDSNGELLEYMPYDKYNEKLKELGVDLRNESVKNFLFIGDTFTLKLKEYGFDEQEEFNVEAIDNATTKDLLNSLPSFIEYTPKGIVLQAGINDIKNDVANGNTSDPDGKITNIDGMIELINALKTKYPSVPIYVQSLFPVSEKINTVDQNALKIYTVENIKQYNKLVEEYCNTNAVKYIDTTRGFIDSERYLKEDVSDETGIYLLEENYQDYMNNIKKEVSVNNPETSEKIYTSKDEATKAYDYIKRYFTLDDEFNLIIANMDSTETSVAYSNYAKEEGQTDEYEYTYTISTTKVDYKPAISKYIMPFEFPLSLLLVSQNPKFATAVANLAKNSKIVITIQDNLTLMESVETYNYKSDVKLEKDIQYYTLRQVPTGNPLYPYIVERDYGESHPRDQKQFDIQGYSVTTIVNMLNNVELNVTTAQTWIADYESEYDNVEEDPIVSNSTIDLQDTPDFVELPDMHGYLPGLDNQIPFGAIESGRQQRVFEKKKNKHTNIVTTTKSNKYTKTKGEVLPKEEKFLSLLRINPTLKIYDKNNRESNTSIVRYPVVVSSSEQKQEQTEEQKQQEDIREEIKQGMDEKEEQELITELTSQINSSDIPEYNILTSTELLFFMLSSNEKTQSFEDIMRYLLYIYTGNDYGVTTLDFSIYEPGDFLTITEGFGSGASFGSLSLSSEDIEILCKITSAERGNGTQQQQEYVVSCILNRVLSSSFPNTVKGVVFAPNQFQPTRNGAYERANPTQTTRNAVSNVIANGDTSKGAVYFMTVTASKTQGWLKNCIFLFNDADGSGNTHNFYTTQKVLDELQEFDKSTEISGEFAEVAKQCHDFLRVNQYFYSSASNKSRGGPPPAWQSGANDGGSTGRGFPLPTDNIEPANKRFIDCSAYVTWVLLKSGYISNQSWQYNASTLMKNPMGFESVNFNSLQPGDIIVKSNHVEIYAGNGRTYNAGSTRAIRAETSKYSATFTKAFRAPAK